MPDRTNYRTFPTVAIQRTEDHHTLLSNLQKFPISHRYITKEHRFPQTCELNDRQNRQKCEPRENKNEVQIQYMIVDAFDAFDQ